MEAGAYKQLKLLAVEKECSVAELIRSGISYKTGIKCGQDN